MRIFCFGLGYSAQAFVRIVLHNKGHVAGTVRGADKAAHLRDEGIETALFDGTAPGEGIADMLKACEGVLVSIAPGEDGDPVLAHHRDDIIAANPKCVIYLSTIGVYGNHDGDWVDEETPISPQSQRSIARANAENEWIAFGAMTGIDVMIFRLAGIYGPGRGPVEKIRDGSSRRIVKPGQVFNRIHVADIARAVHAGFARPRTAVFNIVDDEPAPPQDVIEYAAHLMGVEMPPEVDFDEADLSPMARSFYSENKRVSGKKAQRMLPFGLKYETYREGIRALVESEKA
ncbi:SDR family oxidoreductase [Tepidamorphus sp. 3E244]|uniref:SDR family oxidoreductase n=1 Tax=Tepidamorphus sp. 3E244 TaxID=3385498 RepID=UPI0038FCF054